MGPKKKQKQQQRKTCLETFKKLFAHILCDDCPLAALPSDQTLFFPPEASVLDPPNMVDGSGIGIPAISAMPFIELTPSIMACMGFEDMSGICPETTQITRRSKTLNKIKSLCIL